MKKIAVFVSGGGTDFQSIINAVEAGEVHAEIVKCIASREGIHAISRAERAGIPVSVYDKQKYDALDEMYDEVIAELKEDGVDLIVLAGYLTILTPNIVRAFAGRIINIHPALLPDFGGKGFYGLRVHRAVLEAGAKKSGCTVHFVDEGTDTGEIIDRAEVPVYPYDTPETLQARVLVEEHKLLPKTIEKLIKEERI